MLLWLLDNTGFAQATDWAFNHSPPSSPPLMLASSELFSSSLGGTTNGGGSCNPCSSLRTSFMKAAVLSQSSRYLKRIHFLRPPWVSISRWLFKASTSTSALGGAREVGGLLTNMPTADLTRSASFPGATSARSMSSTNRSHSNYG